MKKIFILLGMLALNGCDADSLHKKSIEVSGQFIDLICINGIEYITTQPSMQAGIAITLSVDKDGKPKRCNY